MKTAEARLKKFKELKFLKTILIFLTLFLRKIEQEKNRYSLPNHSPGNHFWDQHDPRFLVCEANHINSDIVNKFFFFKLHFIL